MLSTQPCPCCSPSCCWSQGCPDSGRWTPVWRSRCQSPGWSACTGTWRRPRSYPGTRGSSRGSSYGWPRSHTRCCGWRNMSQSRRHRSHPPGPRTYPDTLRLRRMFLLIWTRRALSVQIVNLFPLLPCWWPNTGAIGEICHLQRIEKSRLVNIEEVTFNLICVEKHVHEL